MIDIYPWQKEVWRKMAGRPIGHALLLRGRKGLGKLAFSICLAKSRLCENPSAAGDACDTCASCRWFERGGHPDFRIVEPEAVSETSGSSEDVAGGENAGSDAGIAAEPPSKAAKETAKSGKKPSKQISITQIRDLGDFINTTSHQNGEKIILIHPAETMNMAAANALLKNLEEPPSRTLFILVTHQAQHLLPTIRSRCRQVVMPAPAPVDAAGWLRQQGVRNPEKCLAAAGYAPLAALDFDNDEYLARHDAFISQIGGVGNFNPIALAEEMQKSDLPSVVNWLQKWCYDLMSFHTTRTIRYHPDLASAIKSQAVGIDPRAMAAYLRTLTEAGQLANHPLNPRLFLEELLFSYVTILSSAGYQPSTTPSSPVARR
ncbi:MAG TPA: DNA polymerase III subunit delta' [Nitrosospira sp.]|nr:DNA polymerase III subunit delta' [Nitrosospira sp.]